MLKETIKLFIREYISNHIICHVPSSRLRIFFYKNFLKIKVAYSNSFQMGCYIYNSDGIFEIGTNTIINRNCVLDRRGGLIIGQNVNIGPNTQIYTAYHDINDKNFCNLFGGVEVKDYAVLMTSSMVMPGVVVGKGSIAYPNTVLTKSTEDYGIYAGSPAKLIGYRSSDLDYNPTWNTKFL
jgi:acetyltransferase-like isoleucine patch superfamily enzyme